LLKLTEDFELCQSMASLTARQAENSTYLSSTIQEQARQLSIKNTLKPAPENFASLFLQHSQ